MYLKFKISHDFTVTFLKILPKFCLNFNQIKLSTQMNYINNKITEKEIMHLQGKCLQQVVAESLYEIRNDAKIRAAYSSQCYDEFKYVYDFIRLYFYFFNSRKHFTCYRDIVDAAHLQPITKTDKRNSKTKTSLWNVSAK